MTTVMERRTMKKEFKCYLCDKMCEMKHKGGSIGNSLTPSEDICTKCIHKNYSWATDKDLTRSSFSNYI